MSEFLNFHDVPVSTLDELVRSGDIELGRGNIISKIDIRADTGLYPIYSSSAKNNGMMGKYGKFMFDEELVTWSVDGGGKFFYRPKHKFSVTNVSGYMRANHEKFDYKFLHGVLDYQHLFLNFDYQSKAHPSVIRELYDIPIPSLPEQKKIASILTSVDGVIENTQKQIDKLQDLKKATMNELLTKGIGHTEFKDSVLGRIPVSWEVRHLVDVCAYQNGKAFSSADYLPKEADGYFLVKPVNLKADGTVGWDFNSTAKISKSLWETEPEFQVGGNEILMNLTAQSLEDDFLGRVCSTKKTDVCMLNQRIARLRPIMELIDSGFLLWVLKGKHFRNHVNRITQGSKVQHLYNRDLEDAKICVPKDINEQRAIAKVLDSTGAKIVMLNKKLSQTQSLKKSLMQDLLTGKVRVTVN